MVKDVTRGGGFKGEKRISLLRNIYIYMYLKKYLKKEILLLFCRLIKAFKVLNSEMAWHCTYVIKFYFLHEATKK